MKKKLLLMLCFINVTCAYAQLKVTNNGNFGITLDDGFEVPIGSSVYLNNSDCE